MDRVPAHVDFRWPLDFQFDGDLAQVTDAAALSQKVDFQLLTILRELLFSKDGSALALEVFGQNDEILKARLDTALREVVGRRIPEIQVVSITFTFKKQATDPNLPQNFIAALLAYRSKVLGAMLLSEIQIPLPTT